MGKQSSPSHSDCICSAMAFKAPMKSMKSKRATKIAHGVMAKSVVLRGGKEKTAGGLTKAMLMKNKRGKAVSKKHMLLERRPSSTLRTGSAVARQRERLLDSRASLQSMANLSRAKLCMRSRRHCLLID